MGGWRDGSAFEEYILSLQKESFVPGSYDKQLTIICPSRSRVSSSGLLRHQALT